MVEGAVWSVDPQQPVSYVRTMDQLIEAGRGRRTRPMVLLSVFAGWRCAGVHRCLRRAGLCGGAAHAGDWSAHGAWRETSRRTRMNFRARDEIEHCWIARGGALAAGLGALLRSLLFGVTLVGAGNLMPVLPRRLYW